MAHEGQKLIQVWMSKEKYLKVQLTAEQHGCSLPTMIRLWINTPPMIYKMEGEKK